MNTVLDPTFLFNFERQLSLDVLPSLLEKTNTKFRVNSDKEGEKHYYYHKYIDIHDYPPSELFNISIHIHSGDSKIQVIRHGDSDNSYFEEVLDLDSGKDSRCMRTLYELIKASYNWNVISKGSSEILVSENERWAVALKTNLFDPYKRLQIVVESRLISFGY